MTMPFLEIVYQAEISRFEDSDFEEFALRNCCEKPEERKKAIEELRSMIIEHGKCKPRRIDDDYLIKFLRCRKFNTTSAYKLMVRYEEFRRDNAHLYDCDPFTLCKVKQVYQATIPESPQHGRVVVMKFGYWDTDAVSLMEMIRCALFMLEVTLQQPKMQVLGATLIVDMEGIGMRHVRHLNSNVAYQIVGLFGVAFPVLIHGIYIINYSWLFNPFFYLLKKFTNKSLWDRVHYLDNDGGNIKKHIDAEYLPPEYEGNGIVIKCEDWITKIDYYKDEFLVRELRDLGFIVS